MSKNVLVAYASKYGSTREIAEAIATALEAGGLNVDLKSVGEPVDVGSYDGVIAGSAVYVGRIRKEMKRFIAVNEESLRQKPVWLFSSGPTDPSEDPPEVDGWRQSASLAQQIERIGPKDTVIFGGVLEREQLSGLERWIVARVKAALRDARDWEQIEAWAKGIAVQLLGNVA
jgi:menaquinone-dependent protoporphyrinogen oxidase